MLLVMKVQYYFGKNFLFKGNKNEKIDLAIMAIASF